MNLKVFHGEDVIVVDVGKIRHVVGASCYIDLSFDMDLSKLLHGYVKVVTWIC